MDIREYIYCHTTGRMKHSNDVFAYKGEKYTVTQKDERGIVFSSEAHKDHRWPLYDKESVDEFNKYFSVEPETITIKHKIKNCQFNQ